MRAALSSMDANTGSRFTRRIADDLQYLRGRSLLSQRGPKIAEVIGALAQFVEQSRVLDSDDSLIGEGFHQLDVPWSEGTNFADGEWR